LYPVGLGAERALRLSVGALSGAGTLDPTHPGRRLVSVDEVRQRVRSRYPRGAVLPGRPHLDDLLRRAGWDADWNDAAAGYVTRVDDQFTIPTGSSVRPRTRDILAAPGATEVTDAAFEERIRNAIAGRRFLVLKVDARDLQCARAALEARFPGLESVDLDAEILAALRATLTEGEIDAAVFHDAEAEGSRGPHWGRVKNVMTSVLERVASRLLSGEAPLLLRNVGLLARYGLWTPLEALNPQTGSRSSRATLVLLPGDPSRPWAEVGTVQVPILPGQLAVLPDPFLAPFRRSLVPAT
ncbi:MAG: hypothetical protein ABL998_01065, partial [Planctomycetota bacterium]